MNYSIFRFLLIAFIITSCNSDQSEKIITLSSLKIADFKSKQIALNKIKLSWRKTDRKIDGFYISKNGETVHKLITVFNKDAVEYIDEITPAQGDVYKYGIMAFTSEDSSPKVKTEIATSFAKLKNIKVERKNNSYHELSWTYADIKDLTFVIERSDIDDEGTSFVTDNLEIKKVGDRFVFIDKDLREGEKRYYRVRASYKEGYSPYAKTSINAPLSLVKYLRAKNTDENTVEITWTRVKDDAKKIIVNRKIDGKEWVENYATLTPDQEKYVDTKAICGNNYEYAFYTINGDEKSEQQHIKVNRPIPELTKFYPSGNKLRAVPRAIAITFNKHAIVNKAKAEIRLYKKQGDKLIATIKTGDVGGKWDGLHEFICNIPSSVTLEYNTDYYFQVNKGFVIDDEFNISKELKDNSKFAFKTPKKLDYEFVQVDGGTFKTYYWLGDLPGTTDDVRTIKVSSFKIGKYQVTADQYAQFLNEKKVSVDGKLRGEAYVKDLYISNIEVYKNTFRAKANRGNEPIILVTWEGANAYCEEIGGKLPLSCQWQFAAKGGTKTSNLDYTDAAILKQYAWYNGNSGGKLHNVGELKANELGIYDMMGNAEEWCRDWFDDKNYFKTMSATDPQGPSSPTEDGKIQQGGCYGLGIGNKSLWKSYAKRKDASLWTGFRVVKE